jgi:signal transduction histidine kinase
MNDFIGMSESFVMGGRQVSVNLCSQNQPHSPVGGDGTLPLEFGEMPRLIEAFDWSRSPLGPMTKWPHSLRTALDICLRSRFQLAIYWGPQLVFLYNDAEREVIGALHPQSLGKPAREVLVNMWDTVGPMLYRVLASGEATWSVDRPLMIDRYGLLEEAFFTWSYSPIPDDAGKVGGVLLVTEETTQRVLAERRLSTLRQMAAETFHATNVEQACGSAMDILVHDSADIPFALLYLLDERRQVRFSSSIGLVGTPRKQFPFEEVIRQQEVIRIDDIACFFEAEVAHQLPKSALILPVLESGLDDLAGFLVAGISDHRRLDSAYRNFFDLVSSQIGTAIASARAREQERIRIDAIAELDRAKTTFFTNVSHEFRTPLTLILGVVENLLAEREMRDSKREELALIRRNSTRLLKLVNTLLAFSAAEAGRIRAYYVPTDLAAFTAELASGFRSTMQKGGLAFRVELQPLPQPVYVDPEMWEKIVLNLLSNAFKFTCEGEVSVTLRCLGNVAAQLLVEDTGIGIQADELPHIFERFHRVQGAQGRTNEGTGIGLALVQELVKLHGGSIRAESAPGEGTTFAVSIPLGKKHLPPDRIREQPTSSGAGSATAGYTEEAERWLPSSDRVDLAPQIEEVPSLSAEDRPLVLVADDNPDMRRYLRSLLDSRYEVETVADGEQALAAVRRRKPTLVLADVMMPKLDGFSLLRKLRADTDTQSIPIIIVSARAGENEVVRGMERGADDYLVKPFSSRELLARVHAHVELARIRRQAAERERELRAEADSQKAMLETILNQMPAGVVVAKAPSGEVVFANNQAEQILRRSVSQLRNVEEYSEYPLFRLDGTPYPTPDQPLARSILRGEITMGEELRYVRPDGTFCVLLTNSGPIRDEAGTIVAGIVTFQDITVLRSTQEELLRQSNNVIHDLAGKLITSQEEERKRIARDLHDDIAQRIALFANKMELLRVDLPEHSKLAKPLWQLRNETHQIADGIRLISHQLHHGTLMLGLRHAAASLCREFTKQRGIKAEFSQQGEMDSLREPVPLVLFRVLQEALNNVARHSGATQVEVSLLANKDEVKLRIKDRGKGFDPMTLSDGLGLVSMRERLRLVGGKIKISSALGLGTEVEAVVPVEQPQITVKMSA